ncbi:hypothetical protein [Sulfurimonas sp.]|uniref:hypothetical protein n=1 Tax=Sulfurimonas sp. TaxID=2022749 RepID=UPI0025E5CCF9|nr:hypothetical protein [Sulfurimonas sp.]
MSENRENQKYFEGKNCNLVLDLVENYYELSFEDLNGDTEVINTFDKEDKAMQAFNKTKEYIG